LPAKASETIAPRNCGGDNASPAASTSAASSVSDTPRRLRAVSRPASGAAANRCGYPLEETVTAEQMKKTETMGPYKPSTLLDFEAGRPLEIEAIWGEPFRRAAAAGAQTPRLQMLYSILKSLDELRQNRGPRHS
jgi:2-dehydropantoate 2-reductase